MPSTSRGYPYPSGSDDVDIPGDMQALADAVNTDVGAVVTNAVQHSLADAAGDVIVASANDAWARKALGTDNHVLTVDTSGSGAAKVAWEDPTANPLTVTAMAAKAPLANPTFTGTPAAPTAAVDTNTTQIATTAFTVAQIADDAVLKTVADAAGDLVVGSAADTFGRLALGTDNHVLTVDTAGSGVAKVGWEDPTANPLTVTAMATKVNTSTVGNLLPTAQASLTSGLLTSGTTVAYSSPNATVTTTTGSSCLAYLPYSSQPVVAGQVYTATSRITAVTGSRTWTNAITYFTSEGVNLGGTFGNSLTAAGTARVSAVAPATAAYAAVTAIYGTATGGVIGDTATITEFGFWAGAGGQWALPGTPIANLGFYTDESCGRRLFQWDANNSRFQQTYGDTGWRHLTALLVNGWLTSSDRITIRRQNNLVTLMLGDMDGRSATSDVIMTLPDGFRPNWQYNVPSYSTSGATSSRSVNAVHTGNVTWCGTPRPTYENASFTYLTSDAWPTTLPGSAVGSIPA